MSEEGYVGGLDLHPGERKDERIAALRVDIVGATDVWCFWLELLQWPSPNQPILRLSFNRRVGCGRADFYDGRSS